jgi:hypothetical protein
MIVVLSFTNIVIKLIFFIIVIIIQGSEKINKVNIRLIIINNTWISIIIKIFNIIFSKFLIQITNITPNSLLLLNYYNRKLIW